MGYIVVEVKFAKRILLFKSLKGNKSLAPQRFIWDHVNVSKYQLLSTGVMSEGFQLRNDDSNLPVISCQVIAKETNLCPCHCEQLITNWASIWEEVGKCSECNVEVLMLVDVRNLSAPTPRLPPPPSLSRPVSGSVCSCPPLSGTFVIRPSQSSDRWESSLDYYFIPNKIWPIAAFTA